MSCNIGEYESYHTHSFINQFYEGVVLIEIRWCGVTVQPNSETKFVLRLLPLQGLKVHIFKCSHLSVGLGNCYSIHPAVLFILHKVAGNL